MLSWKLTEIKSSYNVSTYLEQCSHHLWIWSFDSAVEIALVDNIEHSSAEKKLKSRFDTVFVFSENNTTMFQSISMTDETKQACYFL